jgi:hypothetical protein
VSAHQPIDDVARPGGRSAAPAGTLLVLATLLAPSSSGAAPDATVALVTARRAYYAVHYPGEHGPFAHRQEAIDAALRALAAQAESESWRTEWLTLVTRDRYGKWWHSLPKEGQVLAARQCQVTYSIREIGRPGSTLVSTAHNHPHGDLFPDPRASSPDNRNPHEMFLLRDDGNVWYFKPHDTRAKLYGHVAGGALETCYAGAKLPLLRSDDDRSAVRVPRRLGAPLCILTNP